MKKKLRVVAFLTLIAAPLPTLAAPIHAILYKNPQCSCCEIYAAYLEQNDTRLWAAWGRGLGLALSRQKLQQAPTQQADAATLEKPASTEFQGAHFSTTLSNSAIRFLHPNDKMTG